VADLSGRDRGQIILVAAFALAVIFVTLSLVVNSAIFTENLASRSDTTGSGDALSERAAMEKSIGDSIEAANLNNDSSKSSLDDAVTDSIVEYNRENGRQQASSGQVANVSFTSSTEGTRIEDDGGGSFEGDIGLPDTVDYDLVTQVERVPDGNGTRAFVIEATALPGSSNRFNITASGSSGDRWTTEIWEGSDGAGNPYVNVSTERTDSGATEECGVEFDGATQVIDVTDGTINGRPCDALGTTPSGENLHFAAGTEDPYDIVFENADDIEGEYSLVVHGSSLTINTAGDDTTALYQVTVEYSYSTTNLEYVTDVRVAPGEPDA